MRNNDSQFKNVETTSSTFLSKKPRNSINQQEQKQVRHEKTMVLQMMKLKTKMKFHFESQKILSEKKTERVERKQKKHTST